MALTDPIRYGDAAGGALQGTYPNPDIQDGYIQTRHISLEAITNELIAAGTITGDKLSSGSGLGEIIIVPENIASGVITSAHLADIITYIRTQGNQNLSGIKSFERALQYRWPTVPADVTNKHYVDSMILSGTGANPNLEAYASGIGALAILNQGNIVYLTSYASGTNTLLNIIQINQTATENTLSGIVIDIREIESYASGVEAMRRVMTSANPELEAYASGINTTINIIQTNLASNTNTLSGVITDLQELTEYASGLGARPSGGGSSTATGSSIRQTYTQTHDFSALNAIYCTTGEQWAKAKADNLVTAESVGIIESVSGNQFTVVFEGEIENQTGLLAGFTYFLSASNAGEITTTEPVTSGTISKPVMNAISDTKGIVVSYRGVLNGVSGSSTGGDCTEVIAYASGIETMRRAMVLTGDTTAITTYASGINGQVINIQNEQTTTNALLFNTISGVNGQLILVQTELLSNTNTLSGVITDLQELTEYASGIETLRQAMVVGGDVTNVTNYASGINTQLILVQQHLSEVESYASGTASTGGGDTTAITTYASGINDQLSDIQIAQTSTNTILASTLSGVNGQVVLVQGELTSTRNTLSGINSSLINVQSYASGNHTQIITNQNAQSVINTTLNNNQSGIQTLNILNQSNINNVQSYASGTKTLVNTMQTYDNTLTGYASGIEALRRAMTTGGDTTELTGYASGIETMRRMWTGAKVLYGLAANRPNANTLDSGTQWFSINTGTGQSYYVYKNPSDGAHSWQGFAEQYGAMSTHEITYAHGDIATTKSYASGIETMRRAMATTSDANKKTIIHNSSFSVLNAVYCDTNKVWQKSKANILENSEVVGVVESTSGNSSTIVMNGIITNNVITAGRVYYLSDVTDGALSTTEATNISKPVIIGIDSGVGIVQVFRSLITSSSSSNVTFASPITWNMMSRDPDAVGAGTWVRSVAAGWIHDGYFSNTSAANDDKFSMNVRVPAGTYTLYFNAPKNTGRGIVAIDVDGVEIGTYDMYAAASYNIIGSVSGLVLNGAHVIQIRVDGKNASSSGYTTVFGEFTLVRTGD